MRCTLSLMLFMAAGTVVADDGLKRDPEPLPPSVVEAWQNAGAKIGWIGPEWHAMFHALEPDERQTRELPAFRFEVWPGNEVAKLPQPPRAFALDLPQIADAQLKALAGWKNLQILNLADTKITDAGLRELTGLTNLQILELTNTKVTDAGLKQLVALPNLRELYLGGTGVTDEGLRALADLKSLQLLFINHTRVTDAGVKPLTGMKSLRSLCFSVTEVTDAGYKDLAEMKQLDILYLGSRVSDAGVTRLAEALPKCEIHVHRRDARQWPFYSPRGKSPPDAASEKP